MYVVAIYGCVCVCIHVGMHVDACFFVYLYNICMHLQICMRIHVYVRVWKCLQYTSKHFVHIYEYTHPHIYIIFVCAHLCICVIECVSIVKHMCMFICIYKCISVCICDIFDVLHFLIFGIYRYAYAYLCTCTHIHVYGQVRCINLIKVLYTYCVNK